jgi:riboflavin synthase
LKDIVILILKQKKVFKYVYRNNSIKNGLRITIQSKKIIDDLRVNDSISIDGVCQTVIECGHDAFMVEAVGETLQKTTFSLLTQHSKVNLERSLTLQTRLGGHLVQGHVNGIGTVAKWFSRGENYYLEVEVSKELMKYCIREGSIALNGISLTIAKLGETFVGINVIPHTVKHTTLHQIKIGDKINIEVDILARIVEKFLENSTTTGLNEEKLKKWGYQIQGVKKW